MADLKEIIAHILKEYPYSDELSNARVTKIIYLSDWHQAIYYKKQISNIAWYFDNYGPYVSNVKNEVMNNPKLFNIKKSVNLYNCSKNIFSLKDKNYMPELNEEEKKSIDGIINLTKGLSWNDFIRLVYSTHPIISSDRYSYLDLIQKAEEYKRT